MAFWKMAYNLKWVTADQLRLAVVTESNPYGEITVEEYKLITGKIY
ncbi:XkdX family protein [Solibacillus sp. MA9]|uniref:XkdX family protein n=1 Tax=Solibacillus palustris TaxID=2908203 RepID=A0ABS9UBS3_9BACL|nr:XkdX family protein [Solibacillus sp. MA9]MCH7321798.1 XkdX family protein [Solibacillus sp. MA9]